MATLFEPLTLLSRAVCDHQEYRPGGDGFHRLTKPYNLASLFQSLDILIGGRAAWNVAIATDTQSHAHFGAGKMFDQ